MEDAIFGNYNAMFACNNQTMIPENGILMHCQKLSFAKAESIEWIDREKCPWYCIIFFQIIKKRIGRFCGYILNHNQEGCLAIAKVGDIHLNQEGCLAITKVGGKVSIGHVHQNGFGRILIKTDGKWDIEAYHGFSPSVIQKIYSICYPNTWGIQNVPDISCSKQRVSKSVIPFYPTLYEFCIKKEVLAINNAANLWFVCASGIDSYIAETYQHDCYGYYWTFLLGIEIYSWLLIVDCWLMIVDCWLLIVDCWLLIVDC